jgi:hypothetical protein
MVDSDELFSRYERICRVLWELYRDENSRHKDLEGSSLRTGASLAAMMTSIIGHLSSDEELLKFPAEFRQGFVQGWLYGHEAAQNF